MNFKKIELAGFKSFADRLEIKFESGVTAIVGPNGCGKSNVADAIRWVLGEQSSKLLRGNSMQDVIFNGTEKRKSLSYCEVSLVFDNKERNFNLDFDEIKITRKLFRSGDSEYLINNTPCRLKDIVNTLHDSGIGHDGYSIIGQGKVDEIINSKPENRRAIFEEAAGISKFKQRKIEAERKLARTQDNLTHAQAVIEEQERQLGPLKRQSENAKKYLEFKEQLKHFEVNNYVYQYDTASDTKQKIQVKIDSLVDALKVKQDAFEQTTEKYNKNMEEVSQIDKRLQDLHATILQLTVENEKKTGQTNVVRERIKFLLDEKNTLNSEIEKENLNKTNAGVQIEANQQHKQEKEAELANVKEKLEEVTQKYLSIVDTLTQNEDEASRKQKEMIDELSRLTDIKSNISALNAQKDAYNANLEEVCKKIEQTQQKIDEKVVQQKEAQRTSADAQKIYNDLLVRSERITSDLEQKNAEYTEVSDKLVNYNSNIQIIQNRRKVLEDMQKDYDGFNYSVKRLMQDSEVNKELGKRIVGLVASSMTIPNGFETAIEVALGGAIQDIITKNEEDSKYLINYLKANNLGRATFLPIATMKPKYLSDAEQKFTKVNNCYGVASNIIKYDASMKNVFDSLLGRTMVVATIDDAVSLAKSSGFSFRIVTLDGDLINPQGSMSGGSKKAITSNILMRDNEIEALSKQLSECEAKQVEATKLKNELYSAIETMKQELSTVNNQLVSAQIKDAQESQILQQYNVYIEELNKELLSQNQEKVSLESRIEVIETAIKTASGNDGEEDSINLDANNEIELQQKQFADLRNKRDEYHEEMTQLKIKLASYEADLVSVEAEIARLEKYIEDCVTRLRQLVENLNKTNAIIIEAQGMVDIEKQTEEAKQTQIQIDKANAELDSFDETKQNLQSEIKVLDDARSVLMNEINALSEKKYQEDANLAKVDTDIEAMQEKIFEEYELTYASCLPYKEENYDIENGLIETNRLKKEISKLGNVNVNAIEDCKDLLERYETLSTQANDLITAKEDLIKIIKDLSVEMLTKFEQEFSKIQQNFSQIFKELFGGGNAKLQLTESEDPLEAGVEIVAEPPGKKLQSITLLSGGEKALTAIAILFAILKLRPMPFCLLDEIEAALDDANVERFASYLKNFSRETQFIVITHRKPTMVLADSLYGVTMEEKGVSRLVSVKLSDAQKLAK